MSSSRQHSGCMAWLKDGAGAALRDAIVIAVLFGGVGIAVNFFHPENIPLVADVEYETIVPCPEPGGEVNAITPDDPMLSSEKTFFVDARSAEQHAQWKYQGAMNVTYDYLDPTPEAVVKDLARSIARSKSTRVVVYGDGDTPDTGEQLGKEISGHGIKNVFYVRGGAPALLSDSKDGGEP